MLARVYLCICVCATENFVVYDGVTFCDLLLHSLCQNLYEYFQLGFNEVKLMKSNKKLSNSIRKPWEINSVDSIKADSKESSKFI